MDWNTSQMFTQSLLNAQFPGALKRAPAPRRELTLQDWIKTEKSFSKTDSIKSRPQLTQSHLSPGPGPGPNFIEPLNSRFFAYCTFFIS